MASSVLKPRDTSDSIVFHLSQAQPEEPKASLRNKMPELSLKEGVKIITREEVRQVFQAKEQSV